jgi:hypothetical protein
LGVDLQEVRNAKPLPLANLPCARTQAPGLRSRNRLPNRWESAPAAAAINASSALLAGAGFKVLFHARHMDANATNATQVLANPSSSR